LKIKIIDLLEGAASVKLTTAILSEGSYISNNLLSWMVAI